MALNPGSTGQNLVQGIVAKQPPPGPAPAGMVWNPYYGRYQTQADYDAWNNAVNTQSANDQLTQADRAEGASAGAGGFQGDTLGFSMPASVVNGASDAGAVADLHQASLAHEEGQEVANIVGRGAGVIVGGIYGGPGGAVAGYKTGDKLSNYLSGHDADEAASKLPGGADYTPPGAYSPVTRNPLAQNGAVPTKSTTGGAGGTGTVISPLTAPTGANGITPEIQAMLQRFQSRGAPPIAPVTVGQGQQAQAGVANPATVGPAARASAGFFGGAPVGPAALAAGSTSTAGTSNATQVNQGQSNQTRSQQEQSIADLVAASRGLVPSAAEIQLHQATDRNVANQFALASALQGRSAGGALKQASDQAGAINAQAAGDAAALRANEQANARVALSNSLFGVRQGDITPEITNAQLGNATGIANAGNITTSNVNNAKILSDIAAGNAAEQNKLSALQSTLVNQAGINNANNATTVNVNNADQQNMLTGKQADLQNAAAIANANNATSASQTNANNSTTLVGKQADINQQSAVDNVTNMLKARGLDDDQIARFMQSLVTSKGQDLGFQTDTQRNLIAQQLGLGGLGIDQQKLALAASQNDWNKTKDILTLGGSAATTVGSSQWFQNLLNGKSSNDTTAVDGGPGSSFATTGSTDDNVSGTGNDIFDNGTG